MAPWILGSLFFVFIFGFILYVLTRNVAEPGIVRPGIKMALEGNTNSITKNRYKQRISRDYQVVFSPQAFVHYPFGLRVVIAAEGFSEIKPVVSDFPLNGRCHFEESYYYNWPQAANEDAQLVVQNGQFEFEVTEAEPAIRVELRFTGGVFQEPPSAQEQIVRRDRETTYSFWLTPLKAQECLLTIVISPGTKVSVDGRGKISTADSRPEFESVTLPLVISVTHFPVRLR